MQNDTAWRLWDYLSVLESVSMGILALSSIVFVVTVIMIWRGYNER